MQHHVLILSLLSGLYLACQSVRQNESSAMQGTNASPLKQLIQVAEEKAEIVVKKPGTGIKKFAVRSFKSVSAGGSLCNPATSDELMTGFFEVLLSPLTNEEQLLEETLIKQAQDEFEALMASQGVPGEYHICLNGGFDQHGSSVEEMYTFILAYDKKVNFIIDRTTLNYID